MVLGPGFARGGGACPRVPLERDSHSQKITPPEAHDGRVRRGASVASIPTARATGNTPTKLGLPPRLRVSGAGTTWNAGARWPTALLHGDGDRYGNGAGRDDTEQRPGGINA